MVKTKKFQTLERKIFLLQDEAKKKKLSIQEILRILSGKGRSLILILLSMPFCQPIQIPGLSIPFGFAIAFTGLRMALGKRVWAPKRLLAVKISSQTLEKITGKTLILMKKIKPLIHPRLIWMSKFTYMRNINGLIIFILGVFLSFPLPIPLSNLTAAWSIFLVALGMLEDDGIFLLIGYAFSLLTFMWFFLTLITLEKFF